MRRCSQCGSLLFETQERCSRCGAVSGSATSGQVIVNGIPLTNTPPDETPSPAPGLDIDLDLPEKPTKNAPYRPPEISRRRKKLRLILGVLVAGLALLVLAAMGVWLFWIRPSYQQAQEQIQRYWHEQVNSDAAALTEMVPDGFWSYIHEEYGYSRRACTEAYYTYLEHKADLLGMPIQASWKVEDWKIGTDQMAVLDPVQTRLAQYGLSCDRAVWMRLDLRLLGQATERSFKDEFWIVEIDGQWYHVQVMQEIDNLCQKGEVE